MKLAQALRTGSWAVVLMAFVAVGREGLETAVYFWSAAQAAGESAQPLLGFVLGIAVLTLFLLPERTRTEPVPITTAPTTAAA